MYTKEKLVDLDDQELTMVTWEDGETFFYNNKNQSHRLGGPAVIGSDGKEEYWLNNKKYSKFNHERMVTKFENKSKIG